MPDSEPVLEPNPEPTEWLIVPPAGIPGCPLEDWLGALTQAGAEVLAKRQPEGLWLMFDAGCPIQGFVSIERGLVEAINFEIPDGTTFNHCERLRKAAEALTWEIWDQNAIDGDNDWDEDDPDKD